MTAAMVKAWMPGLNHVLASTCPMEALGRLLGAGGAWSHDPDEANLAQGVDALLGGRGVSHEVMAGLRAGKYVRARGDSLWITPKGYRLLAAAAAAPPPPRRPCPFAGNCGRCNPENKSNRKGTPR
jgi:hypothetical protein